MRKCSFKFLVQADTKMLFKAFFYRRLRRPARRAFFPTLRRAARRLRITFLIRLLPARLARLATLRRTRLFLAALLVIFFTDRRLRPLRPLRPLRVLRALLDRRVLLLDFRPLRREDRFATFRIFPASLKPCLVLTRIPFLTPRARASLTRVGVPAWPVRLR